MLFRRETAVLVVALLLSTSGCISLDRLAPPREEPALQTTDVPETDSDEEVAGGVTQVREYWPLDDDLRIPQFVGMNLDDAIDLANRLRLNVNDEDAWNERNIWNRSNWTVVWQNFAPGRPAGEKTYVDLRALKHDEITSEVTDTLAFDLHTDERMFTGTITGYERDGLVGISTVFVDAKPVQLDLISPLAPGCGSALKEGLDAAREALVGELPIGQRVLVVMSEKYADAGFIHVLEGRSVDPVVTPPEDSVNERLIRTGWWVPDSLSMEGGIGLDSYGESTVAFELYSPRSSITSQAVDYVRYIAQAGDEAVRKYIGTVGDCRRAAEADRDAYIDSWREAERERLAREAELERLVESGHYNCRDGDGDGICYER
ncbi:MAG: PASTA domain-containing protein [Microcella pacifica]|uniref:Lipoprotein n=1 Tax=Microcella pacifica TaxID=2591847 RepID=A0A9E5JMC3_9MICO|nr:PASTA domain-containing protein [Microcella pacifica]NHF63293.1 hypothetical protein [Microcella pacifica]